MSSVQTKKKNLFKFFKSKDFNEARVKMCAIYIILSYLNELHEDVDSLLKGYEGMFIGELKHASLEATKALERYDRLYMAHIGSDGIDLGEATIDVTSKLDLAIQQNKFFLQEGSKAIRAALDEQIEERVKDDKQLEKEAKEDFEIITESERKEALYETLRLAKKRMDEFDGDVLKAVEIGFNVAVNYVNRVYLQS